MINIGILITATGEYSQFLEPVWGAIKAIFLPSFPKHLVLFTDDASAKSTPERTVIPIARRGFPGDTLYRYHHYACAMDTIRGLGLDVLYAMDVDMMINAPVGTEVLPTARHPIVMVTHPGYDRKGARLRHGTPETNPESTAFIAENELRECYVSGAFVGGFLRHFSQISESIKAQIDCDEKNGITAAWHDESHLNRVYVSRREQVKILPSTYCHPETSPDVGLKPKILALEKQHSAMRDKALHVSILIPLYNGVEFLDECLESINRQSYPYYEVLIGVNGHGRSSSVFRRAEHHASDQVHVVRYDTKGAPMTCNAMKEDASHDLLCMLDVDDKWAEGKLEAQISAFRHGFIDVVGTHCRYFGSRSDSPAIPSGWIEPARFLEMNPIINSSVMMQRHQVRWRDHLVYDYELWLRMVFEDRRIFYNICQPLCHHRIHRGSYFNNRNDDEAAALRQYWVSRVSEGAPLGGTPVA